MVKILWQNLLFTILLFFYLFVYVIYYIGARITFNPNKWLGTIDTTPLHLFSSLWPIVFLHTDICIFYTCNNFCNVCKFLPESRRICRTADASWMSGRGRGCPPCPAPAAQPLAGAGRGRARPSQPAPRPRQPMRRPLRHPSPSNDGSNGGGGRFFKFFGSLCGTRSWVRGKAQNMTKLQFFLLTRAYVTFIFSHWQKNWNTNFN